MLAELAFPRFEKPAWLALVSDSTQVGQAGASPSPAAAGSLLPHQLLMPTMLSGDPSTFGSALLPLTI